MRFWEPWPVPLAYPIDYPWLLNHPAIQQLPPSSREVYFELLEVAEQGLVRSEDYIAALAAHNGRGGDELLALGLIDWVDPSISSNNFAVYVYQPAKTIAEQAKEEVVCAT